MSLSFHLELLVPFWTQWSGRDAFLLHLRQCHSLSLFRHLLICSCSTLASSVLQSFGVFSFAVVIKGSFPSIHYLPLDLCCCPIYFHAFFLRSVHSSFCFPSSVVILSFACLVVDVILACASSPLCVAVCNVLMFSVFVASSSLFPACFTHLYLSLPSLVLLFEPMN